MNKQFCSNFIKIIVLTLFTISLNQAVLGQSDKIISSIQQFYPKTKTSSINTFEGFLENIDIADETGEFLIVLKARDGQRRVYLFDLNGKLSWEISADNARISNNGKAILIEQGDGYENARYRLYNQDKELIFETTWIGPLGNIQVFTEDGLFVYRKKIYKYDGTVRDLILPPAAKPIAWTTIALINENIMGVNIPVKIDTIPYDQQTIRTAPLGTKRRVQRPVQKRGYLKTERHNVYYLMDLRGNIIQEIDVGINGSGYLRPLGDKILMHIRKKNPSKSNNFTNTLSLLDSNGKQLWQAPSSLGIVDTELYIDEKYIFAYNGNHSKFMILNKENGELLDSFATKGEKHLGRLFGIYRINDEVLLSYGIYDHVANTVKFRTSQMVLAKTGKIKNIEIAGQNELILKLPKQDAFIYYTDAKSLQKGADIQSRSFTIKKISKEK